MWSRHTFSPACLEPTRTGVGSPGAKMENEVEVSIQSQRIEVGRRWLGESVTKGSQGGPKRDGKGKARKMEVPTRLGGEEGTIWEDERHRCKGGGVHEVG